VKTNDLIDSLSEKLAPTRTAPLYRYMVVSLVAGAVLSVALSLAGLGPRTLNSRPDIVFVFAKIAFAASIIAVGAFFLMRASVPGRTRPANHLLAILPIALLALLWWRELIHVSPQHLHEQIFGTNWSLCIFAIPAIAIAPYALIVATIRKRAAPTDLVRAGAFAGMTSGGISALAYAVHCTDDSILFVASWYVAAVAICALIGALLGPRILRW
jgi:hypothetical protein